MLDVVRSGKAVAAAVVVALSTLAAGVGAPRRRGGADPGTVSPAPRARRSRPTTCGTRPSPACPSTRTAPPGSPPWTPPPPSSTRTTALRPTRRSPTASRGRSSPRGPRLPSGSSTRPRAIPVPIHCRPARPSSRVGPHALMVEPGHLHALREFATHYRAGGRSRPVGAVWSLDSDALRPAGWTSADAAGLPILPGLVNYDEVASGAMDHAIRFTVACTQESYLWPARHEAGQPDASCPRWVPGSGCRRPSPCPPRPPRRSARRC